MTCFNPLTTVLNQNNLTDPNYIDWKHNLFRDLTCAIEAWKKAHKMARCYILSSMSNVLQTQNESFATSYEIMENLNKMDHVLKMMSLLGDMTTLGAQIDGENQVHIVLHYSLSTLLKELQAAEGLIKTKTSTPMKKWGGSKKSNGGKPFKRAAQTPRQAHSTSGNKQANAKCFHSGGKEHWKIACRKFLAKKGTYYAYITESYLAVRYAKDGCVDSGDTGHVYNFMQGFQQTRQLSRGEVWLYLGDSTKVAAVVIGNLSSSFNRGKMTNEALELVHSDVCGPMSTTAKDGYEYFITFIDVYFCSGSIYLMLHKFEAFDEFNELNAKSERN
ncbi:hypothetical protein ABFS82_13G041300 [Erythranthe guttata]